MRPLETMFLELPGQKVEGEAADLIKMMCPGNPGQKANRNSAQAVGSMETILAGIPGQEVNITGCGRYRN